MFPFPLLLDHFHHLRLTLLQIKDHQSVSELSCRVRCTRQDGYRVQSTVDALTN